MTASYQPEITLETLFDDGTEQSESREDEAFEQIVSASLDITMNGYLNENGYSNGNGNGHVNYSSDGPKPSSIQLNAANGNSPGKTLPQPNLLSPEISQAVIALQELKNELKQAGLLAKPELQKQLVKLVEFVSNQSKQPNQNSQSVHSPQIQRQRLLAVAAKFRKAKDCNSLFDSAVVVVQKLLQADRVLIFRFDSSDKGTVLKEALEPGWTPILETGLPATFFGNDRSEDYLAQQIVVLDSNSKIQTTPHRRQLLAQFQVKASLTVPILVGGQIWGLLSVQQCSYDRNWLESEISLLYQIVVELALNLQTSEFQAQLQQQVAQEKAITRVIEKIRQSLDIDEIFKTTTQEVRLLLQADRVAVYRFNSDWGGVFIADSVARGWTSAIGKVINDTCLQETEGGRYRHNTSLAVDDIYTCGYAPCHIELLEDLEAKAYMIAPVFKEEKLWGLLAAYQNDHSRHWQDSELNLLTHIGAQFGVALQQAELISQSQQQAEREKAIAKVIERIRKSLDINNIFKTTTQEVRSLLNADRVAIYRFNPDWSGVFVADSVAYGWSSVMGTEIHDTCLMETQGGRYRQNVSFAVNDIYRCGYANCHIEILEKLEAKAYVIAPVFQGDRLWGLLAAYQNTQPRQWQESEVNLLTQMGVQFGLALEQAELLSQAQFQVERERSVAKIFENMRQSSNIDNIFRITTQEVRQLLKTDRVAVYRFNLDWSGEFVAEAVGNSWVKLVGPETRTTWEDTHLQETQGGRYRNNETFVVHDIYKAGHTQCHIEILEQFEAKAYVLAPIFIGQKLWGIMGVYQNSSARRWQEAEVNLLSQIAAQLGLALQQAEFLQQIQQQAETDRATSTIVDRIRQFLDVNTIFRSTTQEVRQLIKADRVAIYRFNPDWSGSFVAEAFTSGWVKLVGTEIGTNVRDTYLQETQGGRYRNNEWLAVDDIYKAGHAPCHIEILEQFEARAYVLVPVFVGQELWGLLCAYQNANSRHWEETEVKLLRQVALQMGIALQQAETLEKLRIQSEQLAQSADREKCAKELLQQRVMQLLMAVKPVFSGDLTVRVPITEDEVGTIADAYNNTIQSLRKIVAQVQTAAVQVAGTSQQSETAIVNLSQQAQLQLQEVSHALTQIQAMVDSTQVVAANAQQVQQAVQQANQTVKQGDTAMNRTVDGILEIRETVAETSKKIKRLSESSQRISKVVSLISNFTTQTQLLALNASIEATRAGEYGRGFSVVADEVRSLSRQSADATKEIEQLVQEIQIETNSVSTAMEAGIQQVIGGTNLVKETRQQLTAIVAATAQISKLIQDITQATQIQTQQAQSVTQVMADVATIAKQTSVSSSEISASFQELLTTAEQLQTSAGRFKVD